MKNTGIIINFDELGIIVISKEPRTALIINIKDELIIITEYDAIVL